MIILIWKIKKILLQGLDEDKQDGIIKLYTIIYNDILFNIECTCLKDIIHPPSSEGYKGAVNNIIQLKGNGKILIGTSQGYFLYKIPNLENYNKDSITSPFTKSRN